MTSTHDRTCAVQTASDDGRARGVTRPGLVLLALLAGQFMAILDVSIVNVAAANVRTDLHASGAGVQLVVSGYTMSYAILLVAGARLGDRFGHGRLFRLGLVAFTAMSLLCGLAPNAATLILFRILQGAGAALMMPQVMSLIQRTFDGAARTRALSLYAAVIAGGSVVGQVVGGLLVSADILGSGWRPVFLLNVPIGLVLIVLARRVLPRDAGNPSRRIDLPGTSVLAAAVFLLVLPLVLGHEERWPWWTFASLAACVVAVLGFVVVERRVERRGGTPIVSRRVLRAPGLAVGAIVLLLNLTNYSGFLFASALHLQSGLGYSPAKAGLVFALAAFTFALIGLTWQRLPRAWHGPMIPVGLAVAALAYYGVGALFEDGQGAGVGEQVALAVLGFALGLAFSPVMGRALANVPVETAADASGVMVTVLQLGQVLGVASFGTLYLSLVDAPGAASSGHALHVTLAVVAITGLVAAAAGARLVRGADRQAAAP